MSFTTVLSYWSGLAFVAPDLPTGTVVGTTLLLHTCDAVLCRLFARQGGYPPALWTAFGFIGGLWAVAVLIVFSQRAAASDRE
jgi:hypothetical protein